MEKEQPTTAITSNKFIEENKAALELLENISQPCHIWNKNHQLMYCNDASLKLFKVSDRQEFIRNFYHFSPTSQSDGSPSLELADSYLKIAFEEGVLDFDWTHITADDEEFPCHITLKRMMFNNEVYLLASIKEVRIYKEMQETIRRRDLLISTVNQLAYELFVQMEKKDIGHAVYSSLERLGQAFLGDRVQIWRNEIRAGEVHFVRQKEWISDLAKGLMNVEEGEGLSYRLISDWEEQLKAGISIHGPTSAMPHHAKELLMAYGIKSVVVTPLFIDGEYWGFFSIDDCKKERDFSEEELRIINSAGFMLASALRQKEQADQLSDAHNRATLLLDSTPFACVLWSRNREAIICNKVTKDYFKIDYQATKEEILELLTHSFPDKEGVNSINHFFSLINQVFDTGESVTYKCTRIFYDNSIVPMEIHFSRVKYGGDYVVAAFTKDLRAENEMLEEIYRRGNLLATVNQIAELLLKSNIESFDGDLHHSLGMMAKAVEANRAYLWKNDLENDPLYCTLYYEWTDDNFMSLEENSLKELSYAESLPNFLTILQKDEPINALVNEMPSVEKALFASCNTLSTLFVPIFVEEEFWGYLGFDNCMEEVIFTENEVSILRSGALLIANALLHNEYLMNIQMTSAQLEEAFLNAENANNAKSDFLANMSHEMRTPLNAVIGLSGLVLEDSKIDDESKDKLEIVSRSGSLLLSLVNDLLDISKIEAGKLELSLSEYELSSMLNDVITQDILLIGDKPIEFILNIDENIPAVLYGDSRRMKQILSNLLSNAFKYTDKGNVTLSVYGELIENKAGYEKDDEKEDRVEHKTGDKADDETVDRVENRTVDKRYDKQVRLTFTVEDTGVGISSDNLELLFEDYARFNVVTHKEQEGTGLGLPIAKRLVNLMKGDIQVSSEIGKGSRFTVDICQGVIGDDVLGAQVVENLRSFTYVDDKQKQQEHFPRSPIPYARVLVVDDNITNLYVIQGMLKPYQMKVDCITGGEEAIEIIREAKVKYNAIFMDQMMPSMDGIKATRFIREIGTEYAKNIHIIIFTANANYENEKQFSKNGFQAFLSKPVDILALDRIIQQWVRDKDIESDLYKLHEIYEAGSLESSELENLETNRVKKLENYDIEGLETSVSKRSEASEIKWLENYEIEGLDIIAGLKRFSGDSKIYLAVLESYATSTLQLLDSIDKVIENNPEEYVIIVHGIRSSSYGIGATEVGGMAEALEIAAKDGDVGFVLQNHSAFSSAIQLLSDEIKKMLTKLSTGTVKSREKAPDINEIRLLYHACQNYDMDGVDLVFSRLEKKEYEEDGELIDWLRDNIIRTNFTEIKEGLEEKYGQALNRPN
jgi:signal transduction histidine kinase/DNA-binding response OmpR family regulator/PAS domain-containing protein